MNVAQLKVLALDFDGVIWDSAGECFEIGWRAYLELFGRDLSGPVNRTRFLAGRPLARTGHDFFIILKLIEEQPDLDLARFPLSKFLALRHELADDALRFDQLFYTLRARYRDQEFDSWASWQGAYPQMVALLDRWESSFLGTALATTKDSASAHALLRTVGRDWPVFGKEFSVEKARQIRAIAEKFSVLPSEVLFVDDLLENLQQVAPTGARTALASWGYNTAESRQETLELGFPVVDAGGLERLLQSFTGAAKA